MKYGVILLAALAVLTGCAGQMPYTGRLPLDAGGRLITAPQYCPTTNDDARRFFVEGLHQIEQQKPEAAIQSFSKALELDPNFCDAMDNMGLLLRRRGKLDEAVSWYRKSAKVMPNNPVVHLNLASAYRFQGKMDDAVAEYQYLTKMSPDDPEGYYGLGTVYMDMNELRLAVEHLKRAEQLYIGRSSPLVSDARNALGLAYCKMKEYKTARTYFEQIYDQRHNDPKVNYSLGLCYFMADEDFNQARKYFKRARELGASIPPDLAQKLDF